MVFNIESFFKIGLPRTDRAVTKLVSLLPMLQLPPTRKIGWPVDLTIDALHPTERNKVRLIVGAVFTRQFDCPAFDIVDYAH